MRTEFHALTVLLGLLSQGNARKYPLRDLTDVSRIDTHSHFVPPFWRDASVQYGFSHPDGMPGIPAWSEADHLSLMAQGNISKSILSITSPGTNLVPSNITLGRDLTRRCNEFAADLKRRNPDKFGFWASLPLPDVNGSLAELAYALDVLNADGIAVLTNSNGVYLGDDKLAPVFQELNRRKAIIFVHPTSPCTTSNGVVQDAAPLPYPKPMFEFFFDSARAATNLFLSGTLQKLTNVTFILSHAGGALPSLLDRFSNFAPILLPDPHGVTAMTVHNTIKRQFYFDLAGFTFPNQIHGLLPFVDPQQILFGSDYPYTPTSIVLNIGSTLYKNLTSIFPDPRDRAAVLRDNAKRLLSKGNTRL